MRIDELPALPELGIGLLTGTGARRRIRSVYTTDLPLPGDYLEGGELVLTSGLRLRTTEDADLFVDSLTQADVAGVLIGTAAIGTVPPGLLEACRRAGLPLLDLPDHVSFAAVTEAVTARLRNADVWTPSPDLHRRLIAALAAGTSAEGLVTLLSRAVGVDCVLVSGTGRALAGTVTEGAAADVARSFRAVLAEGAQNMMHRRRTDHRSRPFTFIPIDSPVVGRPPVAYLMMDGGAEAWPDGVYDVARETAALVAVQHAQRAEVRAIESRLLRVAFDLARAGRAAEAAARMDDLAVDLTAPYAVAVVSSRDTAYGVELAGALLDDVTEEIAGGTTPLRMGERYAAVVLSRNEGELRAGLEAAAHRIDPLLGRGWIALSTSAVVRGPADLGVSLAQAHHAHRVAVARRGRLRVAGSDDLSTHLFLLASLPDEVTSQFRERLVGVVEDYDESHGTELTATLHAFLEESGSWARTAARLHVHVNTLRYRIAQVEKLTGRGMQTLEDRVDYQLAVHIRSKND